MKFSEITSEEEINQLQEGPLLNKIGSAIGNVAGTVAKGVGAVAGGVAGLGSAVKKGFQAGKQTVAAGGDQPTSGGAAAPAATGGGGGAGAAAAPAAPSSGGAQTQTLANPKDPNTGTTPAAGGPPKSDTPFGRLSQAAAGQDPDANKPAAAGAAQPQPATDKPAADAAGAAQPAAAGQPAAQEKPAADSQGKVEPTLGPADSANDPEFQKVQQNISKLPPEQQKELMAALMADPEVKKSLEQPAPAADAEQTSDAAATQQPTTPAAQPEAKPGRQRDAKGRFIGKNAPRPEPGPTQAEKDADRERIMGVTSDSIIRKSKALSENTVAEPAQTPQQQRKDSLKTFSAIQQGFERGRRNPFGSSTPTDLDHDADSEIVDNSNTVPQGIIAALNELSKDQRNELIKKLKARMI